MVLKPTSIANEFLTGGGEMGELIRAYDWQNSSLGDPAHWPQSLKTCIRIILTSSQPMFVWWGKDLINIYNDAYKTIVRGKHPEALGQPAFVVWKEIWNEAGPRSETVMKHNIGTYDEDLLLIMERNGYPEETYYTFSYSPIAGEHGGVDGIICANTDNTDRIITERQLRTLRDLGKAIQATRNANEVCNKTIEVISENPHDFPFALIYQLDDNGTHARLAAKTSNITHEKIAPLYISTGKNAPWSIADAINSSAMIVTDDLGDYGELPSGPWQLAPSKALVIPIAKTGQLFPSHIFIVGLNPYRLPDEKYKSFFRLLADQFASAIATMQTIEEERKRSEALAEIDKAKTTFFSNISHEFRTPLTLMLGPLEDLLQQGDTGLSDQNKRVIGTTHRNAIRLLRLVNALLDFSRIESGRIHAHYQRTNLASFTNDLASNFRSAMEKANLVFEVSCEKIKSPVYVDKEMWEKIVLNLLSNAFKYTLKGKVKISLQEKNKKIELVVADTGVGIPAKELPMMFERFHRVPNSAGRSHEGTGIGLSLVNELVKFHHGTISVTSTEGKGSAFTVLIPVGKEHLQPEHVSEQESEPGGIFAYSYSQEALNLVEDISEDKTDASPFTPDRELKKIKVLVVDDNADMRGYLRHLLEKLYIIETANNGQEALAKIKTFDPAIVVSDIMMPVMDGVTMVKAIKENKITRSLPVILLSARAGEQEKIEGYETGADDYLVKPFSAKELIARIQAQVKLTGIRKSVDDAETRFRLALDSAKMGAWDLDMKTGIVIRNFHHAQIFGYTDESLPWTFQSFLDHIHPDDRKKTEDIFEDGRKNGAFQIDARIIRADRLIRWIKTNARVFYDDNNVAVRTIGTVIDITNEKLQSEAMRQSEQRLREMIRQAPVAMAILRGPDYIFEIANDDYFQIAGKEPEDVIGKPLLKALPEIATQGLKELMDNVVATNKAFVGNEYPVLLNKFGKEVMTYFNFVYQPMHEADGTISGIMVVASDVTTQVLAKKSIMEAEENSRLAIEAADLGSYTIDVETGEMTATDRFYELFGYKRTDNIHHSDLINALDPEFAEIRRKAHEEAARTGFLHYEAKFTGGNGKTRWLKLSGKTFFNKEHKAVRILGIVMDISEQRELQQRKDDFIRMASHELKTPVTSIKGYVQLLLSMLNKQGKEQLPLSLPLLESSLLTVDKQVLKLTRLMSELLDLSRIESGKLELSNESLNVNELLEDVAQDILYTNTRHRITIKHDYACMIYGDKDRLAQVFINVINNAIKYSPAIEKVDIHIYKEKENRVAISIRDYGIGIAPINHELIFERFFRAEGKNEQTYPGFGIGLSIAKDIIERHHGMIKVESEKEKGSEFIILLPVEKELALNLAKTY